MKNDLITMLIDRFRSRSPKLFAILRNIALILTAALITFQATEWGVMLTNETYMVLYGILGAIAGTAQLTTVKKKIFEKDKNYQKENPS